MDLVEPITLIIPSHGGFPNSHLPVLLYQAVIKNLEGNPSLVEELFYSNDWKGPWVNGIYSFDHFHSTTHEVLAVIDGHAKVRLGGPIGKTIEIGVGDVVILPAGFSHARMWSNQSFTVVGAYPEGRSWDLRRGDPKELPIVLSNLQQVPLPKADPIYGLNGPLVKIWSQQ
ncbi:hypothetical protein IT6_09345 [Methylacidiphilum caldifontis]|uniref:hypothetical protein n=1 Tax=Methylacidiphilum caldifontis TaxID=2795386 RepID=UPI001A8D8E48|nr:hypothetical protein [Methylacidiphilum caldifontis]QSR88555.1 hypothetical protein IT6_09345 [Methylacidiphilum caldifontis]